jgi:hypothetical protein
VAAPNPYLTGELPVFAHEIPCFPTEQGISDKALKEYRILALATSKEGQKARKPEKFPVIFPVLRESGIQT